jgi:glycosyltransferase involved in cell wall biosynthesis
VKAYVASDCLVLPSDNGETWGLVVNEAMACGLPALVSDQVGCCADLIVPGETGEVFEFGNYNMLADYMISYAANSGKVEEMGKRSLQKISGYSVAEVVEGCINALRYVHSSHK